MQRGFVLFVALVVIGSGLILTASAAAEPANAPPPRKALVRIDRLTTEQIRQMGQSGADIARVGPDFVEVVLDDAAIKKLSQDKKSYRRLIPDLDRYVANVLAAQTAEAKYFTYETMTAALRDYAAKYPKICRLESIGRSHEQRDIWALKISDHPECDEKEPAALIMGAHHSREWITVEVPMALIKTLIEGYGNDQRLTALVDNREIWVVPMVNPDGVTFSQTSSRYWRKNRRKNADGSYGVDPNRNYGFHWGEAGTSTSPSSDTYCGPEAFSEPETRAIRDFARRERFAADISLHSYGELILYPWSYAYNVPNPDSELFAKFAREMAALNKYSPKESCELYPSSGDTDDFLYADCKSLSFTYELARTFIPAVTEIEKINAANVPAALLLIEKAGTYGLVTPSGSEGLADLDTPGAVAALRDLLPLAATHDRAAEVVTRLQHLLSARLSTEATAAATRAALAPLAGLPIATAIETAAAGQARFERVHLPATASQRE